MNPALLLQLLSLAQGAMSAVPSLIKEYEAIKAAGSANQADLDALKAKIEEMDAARTASWAEADASLDAAAARGAQP